MKEYDETREMVFELSNGYCMCSEGCTKRATDVHHLLSNTKANKMRFPLFLESIFNKIPINNGCHLTKPVPKIRYERALIYERWLENFKKGEV